MMMSDGSILDSDDKLQWSDEDRSPAPCLSSSSEKWPNGELVFAGNKVATLMDGRLLLPNGGLAYPETSYL